MYMQDFSPTPLGANYGSPMEMYAHGGHVGHHDLRQQAHMLSQFGMGKDKVLAHINPAEAEYLSHHQGMSINPHTGLPQFGLFDMLKSGASALGSAALQAAPGLWAEYGAPLAQRGLQNIDTRVQQAIPGLMQAAGQKLGGQRFGQQFGQMGQQFGQNLANQYGQYGGLAGQALPRINQRMGVQGPAQFPQVGRYTPQNVGTNMWNETAKPMLRQGLQRADEGIMSGLKSVPAFGGVLSEAYGNSPGLGGYAMPRINQFVDRMSQPKVALAHGGYVHHQHPYMSEGGYIHQYPFGM